MLKKLIISTVHFCAGRPWPVIVVGMVVAAISASYVASRFEINTDISKLISDDLPWRQRELAFFKAFPGSETTIVAVVDGPTPELADDAAHKLTKQLAQEKEVIKSVRQTSGGPFFRRNGLLFLSESELKETLGQLSEISPAP